METKRSRWTKFKKAAILLLVVVLLSYFLVRVNLSVLTWLVLYEILSYGALILAFLLISKTNPKVNRFLRHSAEFVRTLPYVMKENRDIVATILGISAGFAFILVLPASFGFNIGFAIPLTILFYKLFSTLGIIFAFILIAVSSTKYKHIHYNISLLWLYSAAATMLVVFIIVAIYHFDISINNIYSYYHSNYSFKKFSIAFFFLIFVSQIAVATFFLVTILLRTKRIAYSIIDDIDYQFYYKNILAYIYGNQESQNAAIRAISQYISKRRRRQLAVTGTLINFSNNFKGSLHSKVVELYFTLGLQNKIRKEILSPNIIKASWAINVSSSLSDTSVIATLKQAVFQEKQHYKRINSMLGLIRFGEYPLVFDYLLESKEDITEFVGLKMIIALKNFPELNYNLTLLLKSHCEGVVILGLNLVNEYKVVEAIPMVTQLLVNNNIKVAQAAIRTLKGLNSTNYEQAIMNVIPNAPDENKVEMLQSISENFSKDMLLWSRDMVQHENSVDLKLMLIGLMRNVLCKNEELISLFEEKSKEEVKQLLQKVHQEDML